MGRGGQTSPSKSLNLSFSDVIVSTVTGSGLMAWFLMGTVLDVDVVNPFTPEGFPIYESNSLALDRIKSISAIWHLR